MASRTRMLCEGATMCALMALLLLINRVAGGMIETAFPWLLVFPLLVYCARYGVRAALICCVSILLLSLMLCTFTTLFYVFSASLCALAYGSGGAKGRRKPQPAAAHRAHQFSFQPAEHGGARLAVWL